mgnify:CR=1 FL=1
MPYGSFERRTFLKLMGTGLGAVEGGDRGDPLVVADEGDVDCHVGGADGGGEEEEVDVAVVGEDVGQVVGD